MATVQAKLLRLSIIVVLVLTGCSIPVAKNYPNLTSEKFFHNAITRFPATHPVALINAQQTEGRNAGEESTPGAQSSRRLPSSYSDPATSPTVSQSDTRQRDAASNEQHYVCGVGGKISILMKQNDDRSIVVRWNGKRHELDRVATTTGAARFENTEEGIIWIGTPARGILLDAKGNRALASECSNAGESSQATQSGIANDVPVDRRTPSTALEPEIHRPQPDRRSRGESPAQRQETGGKQPITASKIPPLHPQGASAAAARLTAESSEIESLVRGSAAVSAPSTVRSGDAFQVFLRVSPDSLDRLMLKLTDDYPENKTVKGKEGVKLTPRMKASVSGIGFKITAADDAIQAISSTDDTTWTWHVVAEESGRRTLTFSLAGTLSVEGHEVARNFYQYHQKVQVDVDPLSFFEKNWQWMITTLLIPALGGVWALYRKPRDSAGKGGLSLAERLRARRRLAPADKPPSDQKSPHD